MFKTPFVQDGLLHPFALPEGRENRCRASDIDRWEEVGPKPEDFMTQVRVDSMEAQVGYPSLIRQKHQAFVRTVAYCRSPEGGSLSVEESRERAFHACGSKDETKKIFETIMLLPLESLNFADLMELQSAAPRVAERFWENAKLDGRAEFEIGHFSAYIAFPVGYMKGVWNVARFA